MMLPTSDGVVRWPRFISCCVIAIAFCCAATIGADQPPQLNHRPSAPPTPPSTTEGDEALAACSIAATTALRDKLNNGTCVRAPRPVPPPPPSPAAVNNVNTEQELEEEEAINATSRQRQRQRQRTPEPLVYGSKRVVQKAEVLRQTSVLYGLISIAERDAMSARCYRELQRVYHGIQQKEIWAMKVLDASGSQEPGFMWGHNHWIGSEKGCEATRAPLSITLTDRYRRTMKPNLVSSLAPFELDYRIVFAKHQSAWQVEIKFQSENILHVGLCIPRSCSNDELHNLTARYFDESIVLAQDLYEFKPNVLEVKHTTLDRGFWMKPSVFILGAAIVFTLAMVYLAHVREQRSEQVNATFLDNVIDSFNLRRNLATIFRTDSAPQSLPVICGMKSICCFLIMCFHMQWYTFHTLHNPAVMLHYAEQFRFQLVSNAPLMVDVFFAISGFLLSYNFIRNRAKVQEIKTNTWWANARMYGRMLLHRYLRLTPLYLFVVVLGELTHSYLVQTSKFWVHERFDRSCQQYWWRNLLYIQNLYPMGDICLSWTWSLACEMQYYMLFTGLLFVYAKSSQFGKKLYGWFALGTLLLNFGLNFNHRFMASYDVLFNTADALYMTPWSRIPPYVVGVYFGRLLASSRAKFTPTEKQYRMYWLLACFALVACMHSTLYRGMPFPVASLVMVAVRLLIPWAACWVIFATGCGYSNVVTRLLSSRMFVHLNKLTYAIYLLHVLIINGTFSSSDTSVHAEPIPAIIMTFGVALLSYVVAIFFSACFEIPYCRISSEILKLNRKPPTVVVPDNTASSDATTPSSSTPAAVVGADQAQPS
ncbi:nose resistant to fluoxetine protein 6-like [Anopheles aquasalis]|uniref:nose resistant to fluoxetine protein 6-like n=1 Tax=Anopheles aquasalis TaxID=42839 RepID=UPI00215B22C1|nr:nose resistant to fluoxetine protein 6-like [Anopheles aquasalis]